MAISTVEDSIFGSDCPLCGDSDGSVTGNPVIRRQMQVRRLRERLRDLEAGQATVEQLRQRIARMCGMCQMLMTAVISPADQMELASRLRKEIEAIEKDLGELQSRRAA